MRPRTEKRCAVKKKGMKAAAIFSAALLLLPVCAKGALWSEPTPQQRQAAAENRMALPEAASVPSSADRVYGGVQLSYCAVNPIYEPIGFVRCENTGSQVIEAAYFQGAEKTTAWNVTPNISGNARVSGQVLAAVQAAAGVAVGKTAVTAARTDAMATMRVPAQRTGVLYAYHSAVEARGGIFWVDVSTGGVITGGGREAFGGAFMTGGVHFENTIE